MDENILINDSESIASLPKFNNTPSKSELPYKKKKSMPSGLKIALMIVSIVLIFAILGALALGAILLCLGILIAVIVYITMPKNYGALEYYVSDDTIIIWSIADTEYEGALYIPEYIDGKPVTEIGSYAFANCDKLTEVYIPDTVKVIGNHAFENCHSLNKVVLGNGVETINYKAFYCCDALESIEIPDSVTYIDASAFEYCYALKNVYMGENVTYIGDYAFASC
jgi:hypothetical protein